MKIILQSLFDRCKNISVKHTRTHAYIYRTHPHVYSLRTWSILHVSGDTRNALLKIASRRVVPKRIPYTRKHMILHISDFRIHPRVYNFYMCIRLIECLSNS